MLSSIDERSIDSSSHGISLQETFVPLGISRAAKREGENWVTMSPAALPENRSIWKRSETRCRPRNLHYHSRHLSFECRISASNSPRFSFAIRDKALFQDFLCSLHRTDITYRLLTGGQRLIPWREPGNAMCTKSQRLCFPRHVSAKTAAFFADIQQMGTARFWRQAKPEGISAVGLRYLAE